MTDETKELMEKARALLAAATPGAWVSAVGMNTAPAPIGEACVFSGDLCVARCGPPDAASGADAELIAFAVNNMPALLESFAAAEKRADDAEAGAAAMREALSAAREALPRDTDAHYGHFCGGDPRSFFPDAECCTHAEIEAHRAACEAAERGDPIDAVPHGHEIVVLERDGEQVAALASIPSSFGIGTTTTDHPEVKQLIDQIDAALASDAGAAFLASLHTAEADAAALPAMDAECARLRAQADADRQTIVRMTDERDRAMAAAVSSAAAARQAADLLAKVRDNAYAWPYGVAWACKEAHRLLTGGPPDGVYVRAPADNSRDLDAEVVAGVQASRTAPEPKQ